MIISHMQCVEHAVQFQLVTKSLNFVPSQYLRMGNSNNCEN